MKSLLSRIEFAASCHDDYGVRHLRTWCAFAGLCVSAFSSSVFDWHVLFDWLDMGGLGAVNFALSWTLFAGGARDVVAACNWRTMRWRCGVRVAPSLPDGDGGVFMTAVSPPEFCNLPPDVRTLE